MKRLSIINPKLLSQKKRCTKMLLVCDESVINYSTIGGLQKIINSSVLDVILAMPDVQYKWGLRGWAKAQILVAVSNKIEGIMSLSFSGMNKELKKGWGEINIQGDIRWKREKVLISLSNKKSKVQIDKTNKSEDIAMMRQARIVVASSNCWLDPTGCVFAKSGKVLVSGVSTNLNKWSCKQIPLDFRKLPLKDGERMMFSDSQHAERDGISKAARLGIPLDGSTLYLSKFPCRECIKSIIQAGIIRVVFQEDSYGLDDADLLIANGVKIERVKLN